ncbi:outer membrane protein [Rhodoplanes roseus]|nr:outer membrane beta-barrel protein [Rhodoplanes roseus]
MRIAGLCGLFLVAFGTAASAADMPVLRGSQGMTFGEPVYFRWQGTYVGGHASYSSGTSDFSEGTGDLIAYMLNGTTIESEARVSKWTTLPRAGLSSAGWGGFVGYNAQWDDAVLGIELNYTRFNLYNSASDAVGRSFQTSDDYFYNIGVASTASVKMTDLASLRLRGGWAASWFMPYGFVGVAVGRADVTRSATVELTATDVSGSSPTRPNLAYGPVTKTDDRSGAYGFGFSAGLGIDVALMANLFFRAEYEYVRFGDFNNLTINVSTARGGLGLKF